MAAPGSPERYRQIVNGRAARRAGQMRNRVAKRQKRSARKKRAAIAAAQD